MGKVEDRFIVVGQIGAPHGVRGWMKVNTYTSPPENILNYTPWYVKDKKNWQEIKRINQRVSSHVIIVQFSGCTDRDKARLLTGKSIAVRREQLPALKKNEYYRTDLEGLSVVDQHNVVLGNVDSFMETGSNDVLVVRGEKELLVPFLIDDVIMDIDLEKKIIRVNWE